MRVLLQRVSQASVTVSSAKIAQIQHGLLLLVGITHADTEAQAVWLAEKIANLRIFEDEQGKMNRSILDVGGAALVVSQFTLYGDARKGRRPAFVDAAAPEVARLLVERFAAALRDLGVAVQSGEFGAHMQVALINDGPVTLLLER
ncbi:MAG: D-tyrosyl-tRNA(Tyr) deacylase [Anaerolineales bacterium]